MLIELARLGYTLLGESVHCLWHSRTSGKVLKLSCSLAICTAGFLGGSFSSGLAVGTMSLLNFSGGLVIGTARVLGGNFRSGGLGHGAASCCYAGPSHVAAQTWREKASRIKFAFLLAPR